MDPNSAKEVTAPRYRCQNWEQKSTREVNEISLINVLRFRCEFVCFLETINKRCKQRKTKNLRSVIQNGENHSKFRANFLFNHREKVRVLSVY